MHRRAFVSLALGALGLAGPVRAETSASEKETKMTRIRVILPDTTLTATLDDTAAGRDFAALLPLDLTLGDYHGIEKISDLPRKLDTTGAPRAYKPETGDITLYAPWGNLAIFLKPFSSSAGLVRLGAFEGPITALQRSGGLPARFERID
ncbi:cyclophilin-like fold protein [Rhodobacter lacus]|uniref:Cyclophilin-like fold protein n=1 Tax=Rhodobacter lacus TaxID=1641972 RepID=A0ABW5ACV2_9RHOB